MGSTFLMWNCATLASKIFHFQVSDKFLLTVFLWRCLCRQHSKACLHLLLTSNINSGNSSWITYAVLYHQIHHSVTSIKLQISGNRFELLWLNLQHSTWSKLSSHQFSWLLAGYLDRLLITLHCYFWFSYYRFLRFSTTEHPLIHFLNQISQSSNVLHGVLIYWTCFLIQNTSNDCWLFRYFRWWWKLSQLAVLCTDSCCRW